MNLSVQLSFFGYYENKIGGRDSMSMTDTHTGELTYTDTAKNIASHSMKIKEMELQQGTDVPNSKIIGKYNFSLTMPIKHKTKDGMSRKSFCSQDIPEDDLPIASPVSICKTIMLTDTEVNNEEFQYFPEGTNLFKLKSTAVKMKLQTRRPSYLEWKEKYVNRREIKHIGEEAREQFHSEFSAEKIDKINSALSWAKNELEDMRRQDQEIAQKLLHVHRAIQSLRLEWSCQQHQQMLEDAKCDLEEMREIKRVSDLPFNHDNSLNELGFTNMNISLRKYSIF